MALKNHYDWGLGESPPVLGLHSLAKHQMLEQYLCKYVRILSARLQQQYLRLALVDGFSGGGLYTHPESGELLRGSPLILLEAMRAAEIEAASSRRNGEFHLDVEYFFIEQNPSTFEYLKKTVSEHPFARTKHEAVNLLPGSFEDYLLPVCDKIAARKGREQRVIFVLDQYGYKDVKLSSLRSIFARFPRAEVILTVAVDWIIDYWSDLDRYQATMDRVGLQLSPETMNQIRARPPVDWRPIIQRELHDQYFRLSGASCYTPFFIKSSEAHRAYWLLHFSGHPRARDAMATLHWEMNNHFVHFGSAGLNMLGYDPTRDKPEQPLLSFEFDCVAEEYTRKQLLETLPPAIRRFGPQTFASLFRLIVNETPATMKMVCECLSELSMNGDVKIRSADGQQRRPGVSPKSDDLIEPHCQILLPFSKL